MRALICLVALALISGSTIVAQADNDGGSPEPSISFPGVCLKKGMAKAEALRKLAGAYELVRLNESRALEPDSNTKEESYLVKDIIDANDTVGVVTFTDRKLSWASRAWGIAKDPKAADLAGDLYSLIDQMTKERGVAASINTTHSVQHEIAVDQVRILFGNKEALITILKRKEPNGDWITQEVHLDEALKEQASEK